jgi:hypothetical protein
MQMLYIAPKSPSFFNLDLIFLMHTKQLHFYTSKNICEKLGYWCSLENLFLKSHHHR